MPNCLGELNDIATSADLRAEEPKHKRLIYRQASLEKQLMGSAGNAVAAFGNPKRFWPKRT